MTEKTLVQSETVLSNTISWAFLIIFVVIGVLNVFLVHPVPGIFYLLVALVYFPPASALLKKRLGFSVPLVAKVILGLVILWGTLAVTDLAEMAGL